MASHRYWRLANMNNYNNGEQIIQYVTMATSNGGSNAAVGGTADASSVIASPTYQPSNAFTSGAPNPWVSSGGDNSAWLSYDFGLGNDCDIQEFTLLPWVSGIAYLPYNIDLQFSDDNATWTTKASFFPAGGQSGQTQTFQCGNAVITGGSHRYWQLGNIHNIHSSLQAVGSLTMSVNSVGPNLLDNNAFMTASSTFSNTQYVPGNVKDADANGNLGWVSTGVSSASLSVDFGPGSAASIGYLTITPSTAWGNADFSPTQFDLQYSDDNSTWTTLSSHTASSWSLGVAKSFSAIAPVVGFGNPSDLYRRAALAGTQPGEDGGMLFPLNLNLAMRRVTPLDAYPVPHVQLPRPPPILSHAKRNLDAYAEDEAEAAAFFQRIRLTAQRGVTLVPSAAAQRSYFPFIMMA